MSSKRQELIELKSKMKRDASLPLKVGATNLVFGSGDPNAEIMFIGEGPGHWEDQKGIPFVGNAGALLNQLLSGVNLERSDVFITNVIHYRPPQNRDPSPEEIQAFQPYLDKIIETVKPKMIVTLGRFSMAKFIAGVYISQVHGEPRSMNWKGKKIVVVPMYHPAAGLRNGRVKEMLKNDFKSLPDILKKYDEPKNDGKEDTKEVSNKQMSLV